MNNLEAKNLVVKTFEQSFDESRLLLFIKNLLNGFDESKSQVWSGNYIPESFRGAIKSYKRLGQYTDKNNNVIDVLTVNVKRDNTLERARTLQRNFIARHLKQRNHEAALVAFYTDDYVDWRFSLVIMELSLTKTKVETEFSPAKRYSFLVGVNERSHTAQNQFVNLLTNKNDRHTLSEIEDAFNIETVTKEFFLEYRNLFIRTKKSLDKILDSDSKVSEEFNKKKIDSVNFSKKLLGQIVFLYFLQKKGWFGVARVDQWGEGSKKFLRELLEGKHGKFNNFFNDILEPLFYEALRIDRSHDDHYYSRFNCKIPFLNGGLFDPIGDYNWVQTDITLPNELFSNTKKTTAGDIGDGILDIFDRYNFTVIEDEPLEKEVAIDPELLGKAYEKFNAIRPDNFDEYLKVLKSGKKGEETKFNKQYGVFYTPREIVHYMCRESLINYLASEFSDKTDAYQKIDLEQLDAFGNTTRKGQLPLEAEYKSVLYIPKADIETLINYGEMLGENETVVEAKGKETETYYYKLPDSIRKNAKLIDEKLSNILICDPAVGSGAFPVGMMHEIVSIRNLLSVFIKDSARSIYLFKRECIEKSLYGVDIDSGAVEIAKLRLWISLVVDEEDINNIKPLPNLDYKIVCGNSLLRYPYKPMGLDQIEELKRKFIFETNPSKKNELRNKIHNAIYGLYESSEKSIGYKVTVDFRINFSEVFHFNNGFDIVLANPPYVRQESLGQELKKQVSKLYDDVYNGIADLYVYFYSLGLKILKQKGILTFITSNKWMERTYGLQLRSKLKQLKILKIINYGEMKVFDEVATEPIVIIINNTISNEKIDYASIKSNLEISNTASYNFIKYSKDILSDDIWRFVDKPTLSILEKFSSGTITLDDYTKGGVLYGIKTGLNKAFIIDGKTRDEILSNDTNAIKIIKPLVEGNDIEKWKLNFSNRYLLATGYDLDVKVEYPSVFNYLIKFRSELEKRQDQGKNWWNLRTCNYYKEFEKNKIIYYHTAKSHKFYLDTKGYFISANCYMISNADNYLQALLNSKLFEYVKKFLFPTFGDAENGGRIRLDANKMVKLPVKMAPLQLKDPITKIVDQIRLKKKNNGSIDNLEQLLDLSIYKLYNLTYGEVKIIDPNIGEIISEGEYEKFEISG